MKRYGHRMGLCGGVFAAGLLLVFGGCSSGGTDAPVATFMPF